MNDYEFIESLGAHHPVTVSLTVAEAEQRERRGLPLPISGDAESDHAKDLLRIRQERQAQVASDRSWVLVSADTAAWLEQHGLMEALSNPAGTVASSRLFIPGQTVAEVLASPFSGVVSKGEGVTIPVNTAAVSCTSSAEVVVKIQVDVLGAGFQDSQSGVASNGEFNRMARVCLEVQPDGPRAWPLLPVADSTDERIQGGFIRPQGGVPVDHKPSHNSSPSVGAPHGAVCDNPNPTEGDAHAALAAVQRRLMVGGRLAVAP